MTATLKRLLLNQEMELLHSRKDALFAALPDASDFNILRNELFDTLSLIESKKRDYSAPTVKDWAGLPMVA